MTGAMMNPIPATARVRLLVNPSARGGRGLRALRRRLVVAGIDAEPCASRSPEHFAELVRAAVGEGCEAVALAGGDGTVALALNAAPDPGPVSWALLPTGSGNDFARDLGLRDLAGAIGVLRSGVPAAVDVARASWGSHSRRYCCVASVGLDELALRLIHGSRWPRCKALNVVSVLRALGRYEPRRVRVLWPGGQFEGEVMFVAVTNTRGYGGGFLVSPAARIQDGLLDLCIVRRTGRLRLLADFPRILRGTHAGLPEFVQAQAPWVRIEGVGAELQVALDGELPEARTPVELRCEPGAVRMLVAESWKRST